MLPTFDPRGKILSRRTMYVTLKAATARISAANNAIFALFNMCLHQGYFLYGFVEDGLIPIVVNEFEEVSIDLLCKRVTEIVNVHAASEVQVAIGAVMENLDEVWLSAQITNGDNCAIDFIRFPEWKAKQSS
jgi:hypothetical protein